MPFIAQHNSPLVPLPIVVEAASLFHGKDVRVLDMGVGSGRNAIYLAGLGFRIDAIDSSAPAISALEDYIRVYPLPVRASVQDVRHFDPAFNAYDLMLCTQMLHYLSPLRALSLLARARSDARPGAMHVIAAITNAGDFHQLCGSGNYYYPDPSGIVDLYRKDGWEIHRSYEMERGMRQSNAAGGRMRNLVSFLIATNFHR